MSSKRQRPSLTLTSATAQSKKPRFSPVPPSPEGASRAQRGSCEVDPPDTSCFSQPPESPLIYAEVKADVGVEFSPTNTDGTAPRDTLVDGTAAPTTPTLPDVVSHEVHPRNTSEFVLPESPVSYPELKILPEDGEVFNPTSPPLKDGKTPRDTHVDEGADNTPVATESPEPDAF